MSSAKKSAKELRQQAIVAMNEIGGFDVVIVCCTSKSQADYWQGRLTESRGSVAPSGARIIAVEEDWAKGGAGNGLGTLYAWQKACARDESLQADLNSGKIAVGLFHTAGKGTRLAPLPGSECNNKPAVKLPAVIQTQAQTYPLTILEAVIKQTGVYASSRKGRLSVFWGDQVFIPSAPTKYTPTHQADILARLGPMPSEQEYNEKQLFNYGLICVEGSGNAKQIEKVDYKTASSIGSFERVGTSVGSFSVSSGLLSCLMSEFSAELKSKQGKMDTDPHFWMPMTLDKKTYAQFMLKKKEFPDEKSSNAHFARIEAVKRAVASKGNFAEGAFFGAVDVGQDAYWWDYGQVAYYITNNLKLVRDGTEAEREEQKAMRDFFKLDAKSSAAESGLTQSNSVVSDCKIPAGDIKGSVLSSVRAQRVQVDGSMLVNVTAKSIVGKNCLLYNVASQEDLKLSDGEIVVGLVVEGSDGEFETVLMRSKMSVNGKKNWKEWVKNEGMSDADFDLVKQNKYTFAQVYEKNLTADINKTNTVTQKVFADALAKVFPSSSM